MTDNPFHRPGGGGDGEGPRTTPYHGFPLPPKMRGYDPDGDRDSYGRYRLPDPTGQKEGRKAFTRATTGAKALDDTYNLNQYKIRQTVTGLHSKPELLDLFPELGDYREQREALEEIAESAQIAAGSKEASEHGTALHAWLEFIDGGHGTLADVPKEFRPKAEKYLEALAEWGLTVPEGGIERIVWHEATGFVGTFDRIYLLADGTPVIGDVKTSKDLKYSYLSISVQLATYADASLMLSADGKSWEPMPEVNYKKAVVLWVPSDKVHAELVPINLEIGRAALELAEQVRAARSSGTTKQIRLPLDVIPRPGEEHGPADDGGTTLEDLVDQADSPEALAALYEEHADLWTEDLTARGQARLEALEAGKDPILEAIGRATSAEDLAALYEEHAEHWTTEHTVAGQKHLEAIQA